LNSSIAALTSSTLFWETCAVPTIFNSAICHRVFSVLGSYPV
jgi:hypothetical protein